MKKLAITLVMLLGIVTNTHASEIFMVSAQIVQNKQTIGNPKLLLPEAEEGQIEVSGDNGYSLLATVTKKEENIMIKTKLYLINSGSLKSVIEPIFILKEGEAGAIEIDHPIFGNVVLKIQVNAKNHG